MASSMLDIGDRGTGGGTLFHPGRVTLGGPGGSGPYLPPNPIGLPTPTQGPNPPRGPSDNGGGVGDQGVIEPKDPKLPLTPPTPFNGLFSEAVRSTGNGPGDAAWRQNLATYAGGLFARPGGSLSFNPTGGLFGNPTGFGNAPVPGLPTLLLQMAFGGQPFNVPNPDAATPSVTPGAGLGDVGGGDDPNLFGDPGSPFRPPVAAVG